MCVFLQEHSLIKTTITNKNGQLIVNRKELTQNAQMVAEKRKKYNTFLSRSDGSYETAHAHILTRTFCQA